MHGFILCQNYICSLWFCISPFLLRLCIALFAVAEGWLLLNIDDLFCSHTCMLSINYILGIFFVKKIAYIWLDMLKASAHLNKPTCVLQRGGWFNKRFNSQPVQKLSECFSKGRKKKAQPGINERWLYVTFKSYPTRRPTPWEEDKKQLLVDKAFNGNDPQAFFWEQQNGQPTATQMADLIIQHQAVEETPLLFSHH